MTRLWACVAVGVVLLAPGSSWAEEESAPPSKHHYLVTLAHTEEDHGSHLAHMKAHEASLLAQVEWDCKQADHIGWIIIEATSEKAALAQLPAALRASASVELVAPSLTAEHFRQIRHQLNEANALKMVED